jgi:hypothetical protein
MDMPVVFMSGVIPSVVPILPADCENATSAR